LWVASPKVCGIFPSVPLDGFQWAPSGKLAAADWDWAAEGSILFGQTIDSIHISSIKTAKVSRLTPGILDPRTAGP